MRLRSLRKNSEFQNVFRHGRTVVNRAVVVYTLRSRGGTSGWKVGFAVSRKLGGAVRRNRVKRRLREALRSQKGEIKDGTLVVLVPRANAATMPWPELVRWVGEGLEKSGVWLAR